MAGEPTINIKIADLRGNLQNLAKAADSDGSGVIDNAYEHSLFTQYCDAAGEDSSDFTAKYSANDTKKAEKRLVKEQDYSGSTKENMANLEQYEAKWQGAMQLAFRAAGNNPESKAKLCEFIKSKPKLQSHTSMADYAAALGEKINEMATLLEVDLKEFTQGLVDGAVDDINTHTDQVGGQVIDVVDEWGEEMSVAFDLLQEEIAEGKAEIVDTIRDSEGNITKTIKRSTGQIIKCVQNAEGKILRFIDEKGNQIMFNDDVNTSSVLGAIYDARFENNLQHAATRARVSGEAAETRRTVIDQARQGERSEATSRNLANDGWSAHSQATISRVNGMINKVRNSNLDPAQKDQLLYKIERLSADSHISKRELKALEQEIDNAIGR